MSIITIGKTKRQGLGPPPDWLQCPWNGKTIENTFVPFKTPLGSKYDKDVKQEYRFTVDMLIDSQKTDKKKLGVLVDLTNTTRYYDSSDVVKLGCNYFKIQCTGNKNPTVDQTNAFIQLCARFKDKKPQEMIAVHCTHGFHRTGFLIIAYLVEKKQKRFE
ncbi:mRNA-capping enzyme-like [Dreissena polymorpha]|uniref:mRNA-capping enzyme-like n=1 Tax=Dreissena polymorpha TaxID=45954 RepID=UPI0022646FA2|nr:mRNA-capping enzyme-like [Dreissena polymorpha]